GVFLIFGRPSHPLAGSLTIAASWLTGLVVWVVFLHFQARRMRAEEVAQRSRQAAERSEERGLTPDERDANQQALARYQYLTQAKATSSYRLAQVAILAGLLILLGGVAITVRTSGTTTQLVVGGLTALGSSISAYVGATSIQVYNRTLSQLNFYYAQPL